MRDLRPDELNNVSGGGKQQNTNKRTTNRRTTHRRTTKRNTNKRTA
jgi:hypothetical protein